MSSSRIPFTLAWLILFLWGLAPNTGRAAITLVNYSNYLRTITTDPTTKEITLYAGRTKQGTSDCTANNPSFTNTTLPCNSCAKLSTTPLGGRVPCNDAEIFQTLPFTVVLRSDQAEDYVNCTNLIVGRVAGEDTIFAPDAATTTITPGRAGQDVTAVFSWGKLCGAAGGGTDCSKSFNKKFEFSFDRACNQAEIQSGAPQVRIVFRFVAESPNMTLGCGSPAAFEGICNYAVVPGDEKVFIRNTEGVTANAFDVPDLTLAGATGDTKDASGMKYTSFRVYYSTNNPSLMTYGDAYADLAISGTSLSETRVTGLQNGVAYNFWGAMVDQAGTVTHFPAGLNAEQSGTPEKVFGLLDEKGCFIATAAYGTPRAHEIDILREFRDVHLAKTSAGRAFIRWYYANSPEWAAVIRDHEMLRGMVRAFLGPLIGVADMSLRYGAWIFYLTLASLFSALIAALGYLTYRRPPGGQA